MDDPRLTASCPACGDARSRGWRGGNGPYDVGTDFERQLRWYRCPACRVFWYETERYLCRATDAEAVASLGAGVLDA